MSEDSEKPKKIKDIRERLGRPSKRTSPNKEAPGVVPPPPSVMPGPRGPGFRGGSSSSPGGDPFHSGSPVAGQAQEVRIVVDEEAVAEHHEGVSKRVRKLLAFTGAIAAVVGLLLGLLASNVIQSRREYNRVVRDGKDIYQAVRDASDKVAEAKVLVDRTDSAANPSVGTAPSVDYEALEALRAMPVPFTAAQFSDKSFVKFNRETADALLAYARQIGALWEDFDRVANKSLPPARRTELDAAAKDEQAVTSSLTGCVPSVGQGSIRCGLVYVDVPEDQGATTAQVRATRGGRAVEKQIYAGQDLRNNASNYVIVTNPEQSRGVLGEKQNAFVTFRKELRELSKLMDETLQTQGRLETELGNVASLKALLTP